MMCALISSRPSSNTWNSPTGPAPTMTASVSIKGEVIGSADQFRQLAGLVFPLVGVGQRGLAFRDAGPVLGKLGVERDHVLLVAGHVFLGKDRVDRALRNAHRAVDALVRVDRQEVRALAEAVDRAD